MVKVPRSVCPSLVVRVQLSEQSTRIVCWGACGTGTAGHVIGPHTCTHRHSCSYTSSKSMETSYSYALLTLAAKPLTPALFLPGISLDTQ